MPTRVYLPVRTAPHLGTTVSASWDVVHSNIERVRATLVKLGTGPQTELLSGEKETTPVDCIQRQYVLGPLAAQTIAGSVKGQIRCYASNLAANYRAQLVVRVVAADGITERGVLRALDTEDLSSEWVRALTNRTFPLPTLAPEEMTPVEAQEGDFLLIELGYRSHNTTSTAYTSGMSFGDWGETDLPEDELTTIGYDPWIEFSEAISLLYAPTRYAYYHFDAHTAGPSDPDNVWRDSEEAAFQQEYTGDSAAAALPGDSTYRYLGGVGTNAPSEGPPILEVRLSVLASLSAQYAQPLRTTVFSDGIELSEETVEITRTGTPAIWYFFGTISPPVGGWTWPVLQELELRYSKQGSTSQDVYVYGNEIQILLASKRGYAFWW